MLNLRELKTGEIIVAPSGKTYQVALSQANELCGWYISMYQVGGKTKAMHSFYEDEPKRCGKGWKKQAA